MSHRMLDMRRRRWLFRTFVIISVTNNGPLMAFPNMMLMMKPCNGDSNYTKPSVCGADANTNCYTGTTSAAAKTAGAAVTPSGKCLKYIYANGTSGFQVWKDINSNKVLRANGLDEWAKALNNDGRSRSASDFTDPHLGTAATAIAGRVCPPNVFIDDSKKMETGMCLYYDSGNTPMDSDGFWDTGFEKWYYQNHRTCAAKQMRLPTLFETTATNPVNDTPIVDGTPQFAGLTNGVPAVGAGWTWTATSWTVSYVGWWSYSGSTTNASHYTATADVRCVLP